MADEQTIVENDHRRMYTAEEAKGNILANSLQSPYDPQATYRLKAGESHKGYVANLVETVGKNGSLVTDYDVQPNTYSDVQFMDDMLEKEPVHSKEEGAEQVVDGAYYTEELRRKTEEKNIKLVPTALPGTEAPDAFADSAWSEDGQKVEQCAAGYCPDKQRKNKNGSNCLTFPRDTCNNCPFKDTCRPKIHKKVANVTVSPVATQRARLQREMTTEAYGNYRKLRR